MAHQSPAPQASMFTELKHSVMALQPTQRLLLPIAVLLFFSTYGAFVQNAEYYNCMGEDELCWLIRALAVAIGWAGLRWPQLRQQRTLATCGLWSALALAVYGLYFDVVGTITLASNAAVSATLVRLGGGTSDVGFIIYPGAGGVMYWVACLTLLKLSTKLSRQLRG